MLESILLFFSGLAIIPAIFLGIYLVSIILNFKDRLKATYKFQGGVRFKEGAEPDFRKYPVKVQRVRKGYLISFLDSDGEVVYAVTVKKVGSSEGS